MKNYIRATASPSSSGSGRLLEIGFLTLALLITLSFALAVPQSHAQSGNYPLSSESSQNLFLMLVEACLSLIEIFQ